MATGKNPSDKGSKPGKETGAKTPKAEIIEPAKPTPRKKQTDPVVIEGDAVEISDSKASDSKTADKGKKASAKSSRETTDKPKAADDKTQPREKPATDKPKDRPADRARAEKTAPKATGKAKTGFTPFVGFVIGGVVAAGLGYGVHGYLTPPPPPDRGAEIAALRDETNARLSALEKRITALEKRPDETVITQLQAQIAELRKAIEAQARDFSAQAKGLQSRLAALGDKLKSLQDSMVSGATQAGGAGVELFDQLRAEVESLRKQLADEQATREALANRIDLVSKAVNEQLASAQEKVSQFSKAAQQAVREADLAKTKERLRAAVETGRAYGELLGKIARDAAISIPQALKGGADTGVPTLTQLQEEFPPAARRALKASITAQAQGDSWTRFKAWMRAQVGMRSLKMREGDDPDAILSRAEAALKVGNLERAIDLVKTLPDAGVAEMQGWLSSAERRLAVQKALNEFESALDAGKKKATK